ncbi:MAG: TonB-dependent receptor [Pseudomonadota bacterium]
MQIRHHYKGLLGAVGASFVLFWPLSVNAADRGSIEEVVVTATHRETNLMDTAQSISAVSSEMIDALGATDMQGLFRNVTGLNMSEGASAGGNRYAIRGVSSVTGTASYMQSYAAVSVYLDDVPMTSAQGPAFQFGGNMFDMERVEVLKGPQGTLYGEGSVGGTIRFIQKKPQLGETSWKFKAGMSSMAESDDNGHRLEGVVNLPVSDDIAVRAMAYTAKRPGWIDKTDLGQKDVNAEPSRGGRLAALWTVSDALTLEGSYYKTVTETEGSVVAQARFTESLNVRQPDRPAAFSKDDVAVISLSASYALDFAELRVVASNMDRKRTSETETPASVAASYDSFIQTNAFFRAADNPNEIPALTAEGWVFNPTFALPTTNQLAFNNANTSSSDRNTFEARLLSTGGGAWAWTTGVFWKNSDDLRRAFQPFQLNATLAGKPAATALYAEFYNDPSNDHLDTLDEFSIFGEATYAFSDQLSVTFGGRWTDLEQTLDNSPASTADKVFTPKASIAWYPVDNTLTYFSVTTGFRPGNVNLGQEFNARQLRGSGDNVITPTAFAPNPDNLTGNQAADIAESLITYQGDSVTNYELGVKTRLFDNRWNLTAALYYFDWKDTILAFSQTNLPTINRAYQDNAGAAHSQGLEIDLVGNLTDNLRLSIGGDINQAELDEPAQGIPAGTKLPNAPEWSGHITLDYTWYIGRDLGLNFMVNHTALAETLNTLAASPLTTPQRRQTDARITLSGPNLKWNAALFANNLTNEDEQVFDCSGFGNPVCQGFQQPRMIGLEFSLQN